MITLELSKGFSTVISDIDADLAELKWFANMNQGRAYASRNFKVGEGRKIRKLHRIVISRMMGRELTRNEYVDHINGDTLDNRRENLRVATYSQNVMNQHVRSNTHTGLRGVKWHKRVRRFVATIGKDGKRYHLGYFKTAEEAHEAYCRAADQLHGEFARYQ